MRYGLTSWGLASKIHISRIQNIQDRCVRIIAGKNIENLNLEEHYAKFKILKIQTLLDHKYILKFHNNPKFQKTENHCYNTRLEKTGYLKKKQWINKHGLRTPELFMPKLLNSLPIELKTAQSSKSKFKRDLKAWLLQRNI